MDLVSFLGQNFQRFWEYTGFANATPEHFVMLAVGLLFIWLAIKKNFEPLLLVPIGFGILVGNIPFKLDAGLEVGIYEQGSVLNILYDGVSAGWYPPLIFLGIGAMTDFSALIANPKLMLIGAAAQFGIFGAYIVAMAIGFAPDQAGAIAIIGGADGHVGGGEGNAQLIRHHLSDKAGVGVRQTSRRGVDDHAQAFAVREVGGGSAAGVRTAAGSGGAAAGSRAGSVASAAGGQSPQDEGGAQASCKKFFPIFHCGILLILFVAFGFLFISICAGILRRRGEAHIKNRMMGRAQR